MYFTTLSNERTGPAEPFSLLKPTHCVAPSGALATIAYPNSNTNTNNSAGTSSNTNISTEGSEGMDESSSPMQSSPYTGLFTDNNGNNSNSNNDASVEEQEIIIWDRLPRHDHFGLEMPSKVCAI